MTRPEIWAGMGRIFFIVLAMGTVERVPFGTHHCGLFHLAAVSPSPPLVRASH